MQSLNSRLMLSAGVWIVLVLIIGGFALSFVFRHATEESFRRRLDSSVETLVAATEFGKGGQITVANYLGGARFEQALSGWYWQVSSKGVPLARSRSLWDESLPLSPPSIAPGKFGALTVQGPRNQTLQSSYLSLQVDGFESPVQFMVAEDISGLIEDRRQFDFILSLSFVALGIGVLLALVIQIRFGLKPLRGLIRDIDDIRQRKARRIDRVYPVEIQPLIRVTNAVLDENQEQIERARRHVGNLAHALKTPLTLLREAARKTTPPAEASMIMDHIDVITNLVEHQLTRAAAAGTSSFSTDKVRVLDIVAPIARSLEKIFADEQRQCHVDIPDALLFQGEREDLEEIAGNIMENAFKWARRTVHITARSEHDGWRLTVSDDGPGMSSEDREKALIRGQRLDEMTPGHGLGLSIVVDLVALYQGKLTLDQGPDGGLAVSILFPVDRMA